MAMKMARASERDVEAALEVSRILADLESGSMPGESEELEFFDIDDGEQCRRALDALLRAAQKGSIFRVTFGMAVVLDPRNELLDPDADTLEVHPKIRAALDPWQPIETAPKDRTPVLWGRRGRLPMQGHWDGRIIFYVEQESDIGYLHPSWEPTHWMPLPTAASVPEVQS